MMTAGNDLPPETVKIYEQLKSHSGALDHKAFEQWVKLNRETAARLAEEHYHKWEFRRILLPDIHEALEQIIRRRHSEEAAPASAAKTAGA